MGSFVLAWLVFAPIVFALPVYFLGKKGRVWADCAVTVLSALELLGCALLFLWPGTQLGIPGFCGLGALLAPGGFGRLMALVTAAAWLLSSLSIRGMLPQNGKGSRYQLFTLLTLGGVMGVFLSGDLFTAFVFFEVMSMSSVMWVVHRQDEEAKKAARSYLTIGVLGGLVMLMGLFLLYALVGTLRFDELKGACAAYGDKLPLYWAGVCLLFGFGAKAGMFPLHTWLPGAYTAAPAPAVALLSAVLSKAGVFGILVIGTGIFYESLAWGNLLLVLGLATMLFGALFALFSDDLKRTFACSSMSQIGFVLAGAACLSLLGPDRGLAAGGAVLHMLNHSVFKLVFFLLCGGVLAGAGTTKLSGLMGYGRKKPFLLAVFLAPALGIGGVPLFSGYVSKTLLHEAILEAKASALLQGASPVGYTAAEWIFLFSGGLTIAYMAKLFTVLFLERGEGEGKPLTLSAGVKAGLAVLAVCVPVFGVFGQGILLPIARSCMDFFEGEGLPQIVLFSLENLKGFGFSLIFGAAVYFGLVRTLLLRKKEGKVVCPDLWPAWLSLDRMFYRPLARVSSFAGALIARTAASLGDWVCMLLGRAIGRKDEIVPKTDDNFGVYTGHEYRHSLIGETLTYELLLFGIGVVAALFYLLLA